MQEKNIADNFLKQFNLTLHNASIYFISHPFFINSVKDFVTVVQELFSLYNPIVIGITPHSLILGEDCYDKEKIHVELARHFHCRKVKKITITDGVSSEELISFLEIAALTAKELMKKGGMNTLIQEKGLVHITSEELDYSELLGAREGAENKDIWKYLIDGLSAKRERNKELDNFMEHFEQVVEVFNKEDIKNDPQLIGKLKSLIRTAQGKDISKINSCSKALAKFLIRSADQMDDAVVAQDSKDFLSNLDPSVLSESLWEENFENQKFDPLAMQLFSKFIDLKAQKAVGGDIANKLKGDQSLHGEGPQQEKLKELLGSFDNLFISPFYKDALSQFIGNIRQEEVIYFNSEELFPNFCSLLINLLALEDKKYNINFLLSLIAQYWDRVIENNDFIWVRSYFEVLQKKKKATTDEELLGFYKEAYEKSALSLEAVLLDKFGQIDEKNFTFFLSLIKTSHLDAHAYIEKILKHPATSTKLLRIFMKLFSDQIEDLFKAIKEALSTSQAAKEMIDAVGDVDAPQSVELLKYIFKRVNPFLKIEVIRAMQRLSVIDDDFIFGLLRGDNVFIKREALGVLHKAKSTARIEAARCLLEIFNPLGINKRRLIDNVGLIEDYQLVEAKALLESMNKRFFFWWERDLRKQINETLKRLP